MEDLSLEELQAALQSVQEQKTATRLSERNVVELVNKLRGLGLLGKDLFHSINGREYITASHLCGEVKQAVAQSGGRVAVVDLPAQLGVDVTHCERQAEEAVAESSGTMRILQGEIISETYFDNIAVEIDELLQGSGVLAFSEIAKRFKLSADLVQSTISSRLGTVINGRVEAGILYTALYINRIKAMLRGALRGAICPVNLTALVKRWEIQTTSSTAQTVTSLVEELIAEKAVAGSLRPGTGIFIPAAYAVAQKNAAHSFYTHNAYIEYGMLEKMGISNGGSYMRAAFPDGLPLESAFIAPQLRAQLDATLEEAASSGSWMDAQAVLPSAISTADASSLLQRAAAAHSKGLGRRAALQIFAGTCAVAPELLAELQEKALLVAREAADAELKRRRESSSTASKSAAASAGASSQKKAAIVQEENNSDDDWDTGKGKKKKGGKRRAAGKAKSAPALPGKGPKPKQGLPGESLIDELLSAEALMTKVEEWLPEAVGAGESAGLTEVVAAHLRPAALAEFDKALEAVFLAGAEARRRKQESILKLLEESHERLQLYAHGAELMREDEAAHTALQRHLLRGLGLQVLELILRHLEVETKQDGNESAGPQQLSSLLPPAERAAILKALPADVAPSAVAAEKALNGTDAEAAQEALRAVAASAGITLRKLEKKAEKALVAAHRAALQEKLAGQEVPAEALSLAVPALVAQVHGVAMSIPGKALGGVIGRLREELPADAFQQLSEFHTLVVQSLRSQSGEQSGRLAELLPAIRSVAGVHRTA